MTPFLMREIDDIWEVFDGDPWPYGVEPNRPTLEALITYQQTLGLTDRPRQGRRSVRADLRLKPGQPRERRPQLQSFGIRTMSQLDDLLRDLVVANRILSNEDVVDAYGHISVRHPDNPKRFFMSRSLAPELVDKHDLIEFDQRASRSTTSARPISSASSMPRSSRRGPT